MIVQRVLNPKNNEQNYIEQKNEMIIENINAVLFDHDIYKLCLSHKFNKNSFRLMRIE
jgi:hypothetical protein